MKGATLSYSYTGLTAARAATPSQRPALSAVMLAAVSHEVAKTLLMTLDHPDDEQLLAILGVQYDLLVAMTYWWAAWSAPMSHDHLLKRARNHARRAVTMALGTLADVVTVPEEWVASIQ